MEKTERQKPLYWKGHHLKVSKQQLNRIALCGFIIGAAIGIAAAAT